MGRWRARRSRLEEMSIVPMIVVISIVTTWHLFRTAIFFSVPQFCLPPYEFWIDALPPNWPLLGDFISVFLLLFVWTVCLIFGSIRADRKLLIGCVAGISLIAYGLWSVVGSMEVIYIQEKEDYSSWIRTTNDPWESRVCDEAKPYLGTWRVLSADVPFLGQEFPYKTIELRRDGTVAGAYSRFRVTEEGYWNAPSRWSNVGSIWTTEIDTAWTFDLVENRLTLSTPLEWDEPVSTVVLERL